ncbi:MAG TPA: PQQ-binding-like beta-propeller repeat protein [Verrucomicrobiota bacterium]|nr:PQQ-binding-like beta-propeller repeat protein [Verrucomicrobiota bacterium]HQL76811.1 PQQ-binding-like beta-propeller repeat protein [Verrucomicrobiota bacterium]
MLIPAAQSETQPPTLLRSSRFGLRLWLALLPLALSLAANAAAENWPCWRGPRLDGTSQEQDIPTHWNATNNVRWQTELPGAGHASPIVWDDRVFTVSARPEAQDRLLLCLDRRTGKPVWQQTVLNAPLERKHGLNSYASSTPATDGEKVYVAFLDRDRMFVAAYDFGGRQRWVARPGPFASMHGFCSPPLLYGDKVILNGDHDGDSYLVALSREDGRVLWKTPRENHTRSYCAPFLRSIAGRQQMVLSGDKCVASFNPDTGARLWVIDGPTEQFVASPVYSERCGLLFITGGYPDHHILAIRPDGAGNVTQTHIAWRTTRGAAYVPSPIIAGDYFLTITDAGVAHCFAAKTGDLLWTQRLGAQHASLVSAGGHVYFLNDKGVTTVVQPGPQFRRVAENSIGEKCFASPAISRRHLFLRGERRLFCIEGDT